MDTKIKELKERFRIANKKEIEKIDTEIEGLSKENPEAFSKAMVAAAKETATEAEELVLREKLKPLLPFVSVSHIAKSYFGKTPQWFYQRLNGNIVNGKPASFTPTELKKLSAALRDIADIAYSSASCIF